MRQRIKDRGYHGHHCSLAGAWFRVEGARFRVQGVEFRDSGFCFYVLRFVFRGSDFQDSGFRFWGFVFWDGRGYV